MNRTTTALARFGWRIADTVAECTYAQRRMLALRTIPDAYLPDRDKAPDDYAEFLYRASGALLHEPPAAGRAALRNTPGRYRRRAPWTARSCGSSPWR
jgi:hypothetical protein